MLTTRPIQPTDFASISNLAQSAEELFYIAPFAEFPWQADKFAEAIRESLSNTVFINDEMVLGFANFYDFEFGHSAFIGNVIINPAMRRRGFGKQVIEQMIETGFNQHKFSEIHLSCFSGNTAGLLLYRKLGFKPYSIEQRTNYKNESVALVNFKIDQAEYKTAQSGLDLKQVAAKLTDI